MNELRKKVQSFDLGTILTEGKKRIGTRIGIQNAPTVNVPSQLAGSAQLASRSVVEFGDAIERVLIRYGKKITEEQFVVNRIAQATIDTYAMFVVLSRASRSIAENAASAEHEANLANLFCSEVNIHFFLNIHI